jgi:hypothetical protein
VSVGGGSRLTTVHGIDVGRPAVVDVKPTIFWLPAPLFPRMYSVMNQSTIVWPLMLFTQATHQNRTSQKQLDADCMWFSPDVRRHEVENILAGWHRANAALPPTGFRFWC